MTTTIHHHELTAPPGTIGVAVRDDVLLAIEFGADRAAMQAALERRLGPCRLVPGPDDSPVVRAIARYLEGDLSAIEGLACDAGGTPFQTRVWAALRDIPAGETRSYGELAAILGRPGASRAVGRANGQNPIPIVVPCHRVIGADGTLTGFGGGLAWKKWLLEHEGLVVAEQMRLV